MKKFLSSRIKPHKNLTIFYRSIWFALKTVKIFKDKKYRLEALKFSPQMDLEILIRGIIPLSEMSTHCSWIDECVWVGHERSCGSFVFSKIRFIVIRVFFLYKSWVRPHLFIQLTVKIESRKKEIRNWAAMAAPRNLNLIAVRPKHH